MGMKKRSVPDMTSGVGSFGIIRFPKEKKSISESVRPGLAAFYVSRRLTLTYNLWVVGKEKKCWNESRGRLGRKKCR